MSKLDRKLHGLYKWLIANYETATVWEIDEAYGWILALENLRD